MNSAPSAEDYTARARLFGGNRMKLGVMAFNCSHGSTITTVPEAWQLNWPDTKDIAQAVDRSGMGGPVAGGALERLRRPIELQQLHIRKLHLGLRDRRGDELLHRTRHRACAVGTSIDGVQDGGHDRSRH